MLRTVLRDLAAAGRTILMSSHQVATVEHLCTRVVMLSDGCVVANDRIDRLRQRHDDASLESVFVTLAVPHDVRSLAAEFVTAVTAC
jgi:ABC-2 type transport system ATP-binding protein